MLESTRNKRVREVASLSRRNVRNETGLFLVEGPQVLREALLFFPQLLEEVFITPTAREQQKELAFLLEQHEVPFQYVTEEIIEVISTTVTTQGCVAVCKQFPVAVKNIFATQPKLVVVLEEVRDPGNVGTIIRIADAAGADAVILSGRTVDVYNPKTVRSTTGSLFHIPVAVGADIDDVLDRLQSTNMQILATDANGKSILELRDAGVFARPTAWMFGNEARGLSQSVLSLADEVAAIPLYGKAESLNLAASAAICLYESAFMQQKHA